MEALEIKKPFQSTKSAQTNFQLRVELTVKPWTMCLRSVLFLILNKCILSPWMRSF